MHARSLPLPAFALPGIAAGLIGAVLIDAYLLIVFVLLTHTLSAAAFYEYVASGAIGPAAYTTPGSVLFGIAIHLLVGIAWGVGYAFVATRMPQVRARPLLSGIAYGFVVMIAMQLVEVAANIYVQPTTFSLGNQLIAHTLFFGVPVAFIVGKRLDQSA